MKKVYLTAVAAVFGLSSAMSFAATTPEKAPVHTAHHSAVVKHHKTASHKKMHQTNLNATAAQK